MLQIILTIILYLIMVIPVGIYVYHIAAGKHTFADPVFDRVDGVIYKISGIKPKNGMNWKKYALALLATNGVMILLGYIILRIQSIALFNPNGIGGMEESLSFNTIISFMTNTNLQHYSGESGLSYLSQMLVITFMMFVSAASGYAACVAFIRGLAGKTKDNVGNFFADLVRITTRVLLPFSIVGGLLLVWQGVPQNFSGNVVVDTIEGAKQIIAMGPVAALEIIKHLGTNGGGFLGANSSTPIENPTIISNLIELYSMMILPGACVITFGKMVNLEQGAVVFEAEPLPIKETIADAVTAVWDKADQRNISIETAPFENLKLWHNRKWTAEVFVNILENAVKYTQPGGKITIRVHPMEMYTEIAVTDTGRGIRQEELTEIFKRFYRSRDVENLEGSGIGLYLSRLILEHEKGYITAASEHGKGSTFSIFLKNCGGMEKITR